MSEALDFSQFTNIAFVQGTAEISSSVLFSPGVAADAHLAEVFAARGRQGSGHDWQAAVRAALAERGTLLERFAFDSEAGMFCAYGKDLEALHEVAATVESFLADPAALREALEAAAERDPR